MTKDQIKGAIRVEAITIPTPGEFFSAIDKVSQPNWSQLYQPKPAGPTPSREQMSLRLGVLVAEGFIAVEARDGQGVKNTGKEIINLAKKLGVDQSIIGRGNSINDFAENNDWNTLREELEATQNEVKLAMAEQKDQSQIVLVTVGAWVRGLSVASRYMEANYTPALGALLRQPAIAEYLLAQLEGLPEAMKADPLVKEVRTGLETTLSLVQTPYGVPLSQESVKSLSSTMDSLVSAIAQGKKKP